MSGAKPLHFVGKPLAEGSTWCLGVPAWHELALYLTEDDEVVVAVRVLKKCPEHADVHYAEVFAQMADAAAWIEGFDPLADLEPEFDPSDRTRNSAEVAFLSATLRQRAEVVTRQWRGLVGELLYRLDC